MKPDISSSSAGGESATCTICGLKCDDRTAFNAHIRAHLKDKLTNRRKLQEQQKMASNNLEAKKAKKTAAAAAAATATSTMAKEVKDIQSLLSSSPLPPLTNTVVNAAVPSKPDLESLLNQFQTSKLNKDNNPMVMAELAACKPIPPPPSSRTTLVTSSATFPSKPAPAAAIDASSIATIAAAPCTPEISDMEDDLMSYEMEMNRIDFHNDLASILDQIEKDFESPNLDIGLDTPPDSDCENLPSAALANPPLQPATLSSTKAQSVAAKFPFANSTDLMGFDRFSQRIDSNMLKLPSPEESSKNMRLIQSPASVAKVGKLPAKTLAVLNKLPSKLFLPEETMGGANASAGLQSSLPAAASFSLQALGQHPKEHRFVDVVKVENGNSGNGSISSLLTAGTQCIINIECRQRDEPAKIIQTFRAIDTGTEIKLVPADLPIKVEKQGPPPPENPSIALAKKSTNTSHCSICNKCITNKNMARHLEKHSKKETMTISTFACKMCSKTFGQRSHLSRHVKTVHEGANEQSLTCKVCGKVCKSRLNLVRHRSKHLSCVHCSTLFDSKVSLQDHLVKAHPEKAIVSLVQPPELAAIPAAAKLDFDSDDLGSMASSYSFSPTPSVPASLPPPEVGETLADIADSNYFFCGNSDITDDLYSTDLFATAQTC